MECHALVQIMDGGQKASMLFYDIRGDGQPQAGAAFLGCEKGIEYLLLKVGGNPAALIVDFDMQTASHPATAYEHRPSPFGRVDCIDDEVEQNLF